MGNRARIKKMLCQSGLAVWQKKRFFRGKTGKVNREKIQKGTLIAEVNPEYQKKKDAKRAKKNATPDNGN